jgi:hypothetical protein
LPDYYAVLQVHPSADTEVIEAAYRQLMKKHHPDVAGTDPRRVAVHHARSKAINQAFSVLRDPEKRMRYDDERERIGTRGGPEPQRPRAAPPAGAAPPRSAAEAHVAPAPPPTPAIEVGAEEVTAPGSVLPSPLAALLSAYYLLPGSYEWEAGRLKELVAVVMLPVLGIAGFCLFTGRLSLLIGHSLNTTLVGAAVLVLLTLPLWQMLPRIVMAGLPSLLMLTGVAEPFLQQAHLPAWLAWAVLSMLSLFLSARLYVFSVLPTLGACWLIVRFS